MRTVRSAIEWLERLKIHFYCMEMKIYWLFCGWWWWPEKWIRKCSWTFYYTFSHTIALMIVKLELCTLHNWILWDFFIFIFSFLYKLGMCRVLGCEFENLQRRDLRLLRDCYVDPRPWICTHEVEEMSTQHVLFVCDRAVVLIYAATSNFEEILFVLINIESRRASFFSDSRSRYGVASSASGLQVF